MATCSFDGSTFWNDASTGRGSVQWNLQPQRPIVKKRKLSNGSDYVGAVVGNEGERVRVTVGYRLDQTGINNMNSLIASLGGRQGSLSISPGTSIQNCIVDAEQGPPEIERGPVVEECGNGLVYECRLTIHFQRMR